jgi:hypothetical protein
MAKPSIGWRKLATNNTAVNSNKGNAIFVSCGACPTGFFRPSHRIVVKSPLVEEVLLSIRMPSTRTE